LLARSGTREIHGSDHHRGWTWHTHSCNAITVNGKSQIPHTPVAKARIVEFVATENYDYVVGDASDAYAASLVTEARRHILFVKPHLVLIFDELTTPEPATFQYYLHSPLSFEPDGHNTRQFDVSGDLGRCRIEVMAPQQMEITLFKGYDPPIRPPYDEQINEHHLKSETATAATRQEFVALVQVARATDDMPGVTEHRESPAGHAVRVTNPDGQAIILLRTGEEDLSAWGLSTSGTVAATRFDPDGKPVDCFVTGGGEVRWQGEVMPADE
ncbi:MAG: heparinase II/III family protein, partial [Armatimonadota bacterium]